MIDEAFPLGRAVLYGRHIAELDGQAAAPVEDQSLELIDVITPLYAQCVAAPADVDDAGGNVGRATDAIGCARDVDAQFRRFVGIDDDLQLVAGVTARVEHAHARHAIQAGYFGPDDFAQVSLVADQVLFVAFELLDEVLDKLIVRIAPFAEAYVRSVGITRQRA